MEAPAATPVADQLPGICHPRLTAQLYGHTPVLERLEAQLSAGTLHHGLLVNGPEGIGKATLVHALTRTLLAGPDTARDPQAALAQLRAGSHAGLHTVRRAWNDKTGKFANQIGVDDVRAVRQFLSHASGAREWRVVIVDAVDDLTINAANALLKSLEEPPARCVFALIWHRRGRLLPTIRSRCLDLPVHSLERAPWGEALTAAISASPDHPDHAKLQAAHEAANGDQLYRFTGGSVGAAIPALLFDHAGQRARVDAIIARLPNLDRSSVHMLTQLVPASVAGNEDFARLMHMTRASLATRIRAELTGDTGQAPAGAGRPAQRGLALATCYGDSITRQERALALNLDLRGVLMEFYEDLARAASI
ncbi:MAG: hypothetical protein AAFO79_03105 [Pseudomonadota bacterium]